MGTEINNRKVILISVVILSPLVLAFLVIAVIESEETQKEELAITVSVPQNLQEATSGQIAGVLEGPTVVNITTLGNSSNETE
jgi:ABC-type Na+ efflux pump permease subunit